MPDLQFERHLICDASAMIIESIATVNTATCDNVKHIENREGYFLKPAKKPEPN
jgi:hypothetical protein